MGQTKQRVSKDVISASEIGQYNYCSIAWYLQRLGYKPISESLESGLKIHSKLGETIDYTRLNAKKSKYLSYLGYLLLSIGVLVILFEVAKWIQLL